MLALVIPTPSSVHTQQQCTQFRVVTLMVETFIQSSNPNQLEIQLSFHHVVRMGRVGSALTMS